MSGTLLFCHVADLTSPERNLDQKSRFGFNMFSSVYFIMHPVNSKYKFYTRAVTLLSNVASSHEDGSAGHWCDPMEGWAVNRLMLFSASSLNFFVVWLVCAGLWGVGAGTF